MTTLPQHRDGYPFKQCSVFSGGPPTTPRSCGNGKKFGVFFLAIAFSWSLFGVVLAEDWSRFRGPNGEGLVEDLKASWANDLPELLWHKELPGTGAASPVVKDGKLYLVSASEETAVHYMQAFDAENGDLLWQQTLQGNDHKQHRHNYLAAVTPALGAENLFYVFYQNNQLVLVALSLDDGEPVWRAELGSLVAEHGHGASPIYYKGHVVLVNEQNERSEIVAYDAETGELIWKTELTPEEAGYATPCLITDPDTEKTILIANTWGSGVVALDPLSGKKFWEMPEVMEFRITASPVFAGNTLFISGGMGGTGRQMLAITAPSNGTEGEPEIAYEIERPFPYVPTPVVKGDYLYTWADRGEVVCRKVSSGEVIWEENLDGSYYSSPIILGDVILGASRKGLFSVLSLKPSPEKRILLQKDFDASIDATPAFVDGVLYVRTSEELIAFPIK